jgi:pyrimidine deaminase RibD-like protein/NTP pyrophosphatase (non-canonical NTP hydrolase)
MTADADLAARAVEEARHSRHEVGRTPLFVGAVAAQGPNLLDAAHRGEFDPGEHAEFTLLERKLKTAVLAGATVFTTLEPCTKRGPGKVPCAERLIERRVGRVVIGTLDPNPDIRGLGVLALRQANIAVEFFPEELTAQLEELNRDFFRLQRAGTAPPLPTAEFLRRVSRRTLDQWYVSLNSTYFHRNFDRRPSDICLHLIEVIGGLSLLASEKSKPGVDKEAQVPKALAWWLSLCGKVGVRSVEAMLWDKFPHLCPYCQQSRHQQEDCAEKKAAQPGPPWEILATLGRKPERPASLGEWQRMFNDIYPVNQGDTYGPAFARLYEELAELAEAVRVFPSVPGYFLSEAADVFAWLMKVQNIIDEKAGRRKEQRGRTIEEAFAKAYPDACNDCGRLVCSCPPILASTVGRIAHEVPVGRGSYEPTGRFMTPDKGAEMFGPAKRQLSGNAT